MKQRPVASVGREDGCKLGGKRIIEDDTIENTVDYVSDGTGHNQRQTDKESGLDCRYFPQFA